MRSNRKANIFMQRRMYIDEAHTTLDMDIFRFAVFFKGRMKWTGKRGPKVEYCYRELLLTFEKEILLKHKLQELAW